jgi:superfamily II DNA or RNA helicase
VTLHKASNKAEHLGGIVLAGDTIHPKGKSPLSLHERSSLVRGITFVHGQEGRLVGELLPRLRKRLEVEVCTDKLPSDVVKMPPRLIANVNSGGGILEVTVEIVYGEPICGRVRGANMEQIGAIVPIRDPAAEQTLIKQAASTIRLSLGRTWRFEGLEGAKIVKDHLSRFRGEVIGDVGAFGVREKAARLDIKYDAKGGAYVDGEVSHDVALQAWREGSPLVPLLNGGWAPIPAELTGEHAALFADLLCQANGEGQLPRHTALAVGQIAQALDNPLPPGFKKLAPLLKGFKGLPKTALPKVFTAELRPYQLIGYRWLRFLAKAGLGGVLADDMGLGKTIQTLCALAGIGGRSLVVAPTSVVRNWASEIDKFTDGVKVCVYHGQSRKLDPKAKIVITSYALLRLDPKITETEWRTVVLDEAQAIKNPESQTAQAAFSLKAEHRFTLTGTPIENSLDELWSQLHFVMPGFLGGRTAFREEISRPMEQGDQKAAALLRSKISPFVLRRLKEDVAPELPSLTEMRVMCHLTETQRSIYDAVMSAAKMELKTEEGSRTMKVLEHLLRLRQAACHPRLLPGDRPDESGKLQVLIEKLHSVVAGDHKALVFSQWTGFLDLIQEELDRCGINYVRLDGTTRDRESVVEKFQSDDGPPVFLISIKAGGTGINLTAADYVFITDPWWNPAVEAQATDRAHRIGQQRPVVAIRMIAEGTVEERIASLQQAKKELAEAALGGEEAFTGRLSRKELMGLFGG